MSNRFFSLNESNLEPASEFIGRHLDSPAHLSYSGINRLRSCVDYLDIKKDVSFILESSGQIRGVFLASYRADRGYIPLIVVHKEYRQQGYGKVILQKGLSLLAEAGCLRVILEVLLDNERAVSLYRKEGFEVAHKVITCRNDSVSYYRGKDPRVTVEKEHPFTFQLLYRNYTNREKPWIRSLRSLQTILDKYGGELYSIQYQNKTAGYAVLLRENGSVRILDLALNEYNGELISYALSRIITREKVLIFRSLYEEEELAAFCNETDFYIHTSQYEMKKNLN